MTMHMPKYLRIGSFFLLISSLSYQAYGCTLDGIDIQKMLSPIVQQSSEVAESSVQQENKGKGKIDLVKILGDSEYLETVVTQVQVHLSRECERFPRYGRRKRGNQSKGQKSKSENSYKACRNR